MIICRDRRDDTGQIIKKYYRVENVDANTVRYIEWRDADGEITKTYYVARNTTKECLKLLAWILFGCVMTLYAMFAIAYYSRQGLVETEGKQVCERELDLKRTRWTTVKTQEEEYLF